MVPGSRLGEPAIRLGQEGSIRRQVMNEPGQESGSLEHIHSELVRRIRGGEYPAGAKLPSDGELAEEFGCRADIAARALRLLQWDGLARKVLRKGYFSTGPQA